jgi:axial budding pattern protein 2
MARVGDLYRFDLSPSTALSTLGAITYTLTQSPSWLQITANGILVGTPSTQDVGSVSFMIAAADETGSALMPATLVVANTPNLQIGSDAYNPLSTVGARCGITCILLPPSTGFSFAFPANALLGTTGSLTYYATNSDHTPLPAWIEFNPTTLVFSGTTPPAASLPESADISFIAAEFPGFASGQLQFTISVSQHELVFVPVRDVFNQSTGNTVDIMNLRGNLWLDGRPINDEDFTGATTDAPSWLQFDSSNIGFRGTAPVAETTQTISIWAQDTYGDVASMVLQLNFGSEELYIGSVGVLNATAGTYFQYQLSPADFPEQNVSIAVNFGFSSTWLHFDRQNLSMAGMVPASAPSELIAANLTVTSADGKQQDFQSFEIQIGMLA